MSQQPSYYDHLNLERTASSEDVENAYTAFNEAVGSEGTNADTPGLEHMQEAYRVLRDPLRRSTYDIYGRSGLSAGTSLVPVKPLKEQWLLYQQSRWDEDRYDMLVQPADVTLEWDAIKVTTSILKGVLPEVWPVISGVSAQSALKIDRSEDSRFMVGYNMRLRNLFSANGNMTGWLQVPLWAQFRTGLWNVLSVGAILGQDSVACASWMRVCSPNTRAEISARTAPSKISAQARVVHKFGDHTIDFRAQGGHTVSASAMATLQLRPSLELRCSCFCSGAVSRAEVGVATSRSLTSGYMGVGYGTQGTTINVRVMRAGHTLHVPVLLSSRMEDWQALLLAAAVPTAMNFIVTQLMIRPVLWAIAARSAKAARAERRAEIAETRHRALRQQAVMARTVGRMTTKEEQKSGFVVVLAAYGNLTKFKAALAAAVRGCADSADGENGQIDSAELGGQDGDDWLIVTQPTQLAAMDGRLRLRQGLDKSTLPGFADVNPGGNNSFYVLYKFKDRFFELEAHGVDEVRVPTGKVAPVSEQKATFAQQWHKQQSAATQVASVQAAANGSGGSTNAQVPSSEPHSSR